MLDMCALCAYISNLNLLTKRDTFFKFTEGPF